MLVESGRHMVIKPTVVVVYGDLVIKDGDREMPEDTGETIVIGRREPFIGA